MVTPALHAAEPNLTCHRNLRQIRALSRGLPAGPARYDGFVPQATAVTAAHLDLDKDADALESALARLAAPTAGRPALAARTASELAGRLLRGPHEGDPRTLLGAARRLAAHGGHSEGLLAVALAGALGARMDWGPPCVSS
ncbi:hypothetical protein KUF83_15680 [Streptomyces sp. BV286]|uniref:hypothetical protein n=1 Tax=unclassified Streptomyces TaxID=2593676 RepID=UPI001C2E5BE4|nr:hypothetical protein [Streptomyces sp. BV286]MBV1937993.1 hypothetical protein [Streptomyces sp. BV286]